MTPESKLDLALAGNCGQSPDGKLTLGCKEAHALAVRFAMPMEAVGRLCDERGIKIVRCQLGCFA